GAGQMNVDQFCKKWGETARDRLGKAAPSAPESLPDQRCEGCQVAAAVVVSLEVCDEYGLDCAALRDRVEKGGLTEDEALEHIHHLMEDAPPRGCLDTGGYLRHD
ncbi:MAG: hypothetical protein SVM79_10335, partial [Chloroflexota bacterium]|nr:hypothetical protein [Chloroflexota bacterium]